MQQKQDDTNRLKISIITVCFNSAKTIEQTIKSVIKQDYPNIEYVIVDGGSTDGTLDIIRKYENYISYWISEPDEGIYDAMNKGIDRTTGDVVAFLNSDDWYNDGAIRYVANNIMNTQAGISCYEVNLCTGNEVRKRNLKIAERASNLRIVMIYCHQAVFAERSLFEKYGKFDIRYKIAADYEWLLRMYNNGVSIKYENFVVANFREGGFSSAQVLKLQKESQSIAINGLNKLKSEKKITKDYFDEIYDEIIKYNNKIKNRGITKLVINGQFLSKETRLREEIRECMNNGNYSIFGCGIWGRECAELFQQLNIFVECFWDNNPKKWGTYCRGIEIRSPEKIENEKTKIVISSLYYSDEIEKQLCNIGLQKNKDFINYDFIQQEIGMRFEHFFV